MRSMLDNLPRPGDLRLRRMARTKSAKTHARAPSLRNPFFYLFFRVQNLTLDLSARCSFARARRWLTWWLPHWVTLSTPNRAITRAISVRTTPTRLTYYDEARVALVVLSFFSLFCLLRPSFIRHFRI